MAEPTRPRRRALAGLLALALSPAAGARNEGRVRVVGFLSRGADAELLSRAMAGQGWVAGKNLRFELRRWVREDPGELDRLAQELVRARVDVLYGRGLGVVAALAKATRTIPIVSGGHPDPVGAGLARELRRPGGNVTGLSYDVPGNSQLMLRLIKDMRPGLWRLVLLNRGGSPGRHLASAAAALNISVEGFKATTMGEYEQGFGTIGDPEREAAMVLEPQIPPGTTDIPAAIARRNREVADIAIRRRVAAFAASNTNQVQDGLLMYYWNVHGDAIAKVARILDKILRGSSPAEIPFELPESTAFWVNRATARAIGLELPAAILLRATTVSE